MEGKEGGKLISPEPLLPFCGASFVLRSLSLGISGGSVGLKLI